MLRRETSSANDVLPLEDARLTDPSIPSRSCCCPALPAVKVTMPPTTDGPRPVDLWLCGHHYHASLAALISAGADVEELTFVADRQQICYVAAPREPWE
jgi:hypothetical protein